jgi:nucleoside 2-deoxyribosyltransferase
MVINSPLVFCAGCYRYVLANEELISDKTFCFKAACYVFYHYQDIPKRKMVFLIGDFNQCTGIAQSFDNQTAVIASSDAIEAWFPKTPQEMISLLVRLALAKEDHFGKLLKWTYFEKDYLEFINKNWPAQDQLEASQFIEDYLQTEGYVKSLYDSGTHLQFLLTNKAIETFGLKNDSKETRDAFLALKFQANEERIQAIEKIVGECDYHIRPMSEYETNNWIMPELFHAIKTARFVIVDFTLPCDGAYYEAGYAEALGKNVIHLCQEDAFKQVHFDIAQKSTIVYKDYDDLAKKLTARIKATVDD